MDGEAQARADGRTSPRVVTVVLNWYGRADTLECLRALGALSYANCSVILIDNGCEEFSAPEVVGIVPGARYLRTERNLGFAGGANLGMREALSAGAQYVWWLNNDARPEPSALSELIAVATQDARVGIVGPKLLQLQEPQRLDSIALHVDPRSGRFFLLGHDEVDRGQYDQLRNVGAVTACAMVASRAACERLGGFDDSYFAYLEDADLCLRARAAGFQVAVAPRARVLHNRLPATQARQSTASLYYTARNHLMLMARHGAGGVIVRRMRTAAVIALSLVYALRGASGSRRARVSAVYRGIRDYLRGVSGELHPPV